jgi:hypothetical protein
MHSRHELCVWPTPYGALVMLNFRDEVLEPRTRVRAGVFAEQRISGQINTQKDTLIDRLISR